MADLPCTIVGKVCDGRFDLDDYPRELRQVANRTGAPLGIYSADGLMAVLANDVTATLRPKMSGWQVEVEE